MPRCFVQRGRPDRAGMNTVTSVLTTMAGGNGQAGGAIPQHVVDLLKAAASDDGQPTIELLAKLV